MANNDWCPARYIKRLVEAGITFKNDRGEALLVILNDLRREVKAESADRIAALEQALRMVRPSSRAKGCWCEGSRDVARAGHSFGCSAAVEVMSERDTAAPVPENQP